MDILLKPPQPLMGLFLPLCTPIISCYPSVPPSSIVTPLYPHHKLLPFHTIIISYYPSTPIISCYSYVPPSSVVTPLYPHHQLLLLCTPIISCYSYVPPSSVVTPLYPHHQLLPLCTPIISCYPSVPPSSVVTPPTLPIPPSFVTSFYLHHLVVTTPPPLPLCLMKHGYQLACGAVHKKAEPL